MERCGAVVKRRTRDREVPGLIPTNCKCCFLEQETLSTLLSTGFYPGKKRATWKISTRLLNVLPSINKVDYYYYYLKKLIFLGKNGKKKKKKKHCQFVNVLNLGKIRKLFQMSSAETLSSLLSINVMEICR